MYQIGWGSLMDFVHFLSSHMLDPALGGRALYRDTVAQAVQAEALGYMAVAIPEHHLVNLLLIPRPCRWQSRSRRIPRA